MSGTTMALGVMALIFLVPLTKIVSDAIVKSQSRSGVGKKELAEVNAKLAEVSSEAERLRQRVASLETIVTDQGYDLDRRFGALLDDADRQTDPGKPDGVTAPAV